MADLAKYREVAHIRDRSELANKLLGEGWELLTVKIVQFQDLVGFEADGKHMRQRAEVHYVLGKRRG